MNRPLQRLALVASLTLPAMLALGLAPTTSGCGGQRSAPANHLSADSYLPVSEEEMEEALRAPAITCVAARTGSGCAPDPDPPRSVHPKPSVHASATQGVL